MEWTGLNWSVQSSGRSIVNKIMVIRFALKAMNLLRSCENVSFT
jgi:hypothetical protein